MKITKSELKKIIREEINSLSESLFHPKAMSKTAKASNFKNIKDWVVDYNQSTYIDTPYIKIVLDRKFGPKLRYFTLSPDMWFRSQVTGSGPRQFGLMIRKFKISGNGKPISSSSSGAQFPIIVSYLPSEFDHPDDDIQSNWETAKGFLLINGSDFSTETPWGIGAGDVSSWINRNVGRWYP
jgi:hypothetical protein